MEYIYPEGPVTIDTRMKSFCFDNNRWAIGTIELHHGCEVGVTRSFANYDDQFNRIED